VGEQKIVSVFPSPSARDARRAAYSASSCAANVRSNQLVHMMSSHFGAKPSQLRDAAGGQQKAASRIAGGLHSGLEFGS